MGTAAILSEVVQTIICVLCLLSSLRVLAHARAVRKNYLESGQNGEGEAFTRQLVEGKAVHVLGQAGCLGLKLLEIGWAIFTPPRIPARFETIGLWQTAIAVVFAIGAWHTMRLFR